MGQKMINDYDDEDYNLRLYESDKEFTQQTYDVIFKRINKYIEIPSLLQDKLLERLEKLKKKYDEKKSLTAEKEAMEGIDDDLPNSFFEEVFGWEGGEPLIAPADTEKET